MTPHAFEHNEDPYRFIVQARHGIDIDAVAVSGDAERVAHVRRLLDGLSEVYTMASRTASVSPPSPIGR